MPSLDFEKEKNDFRDYYSSNIKLLEGATDSFKTLISTLINFSEDIPISRIESRLKDKEECIRKFNVKYRKKLESSSTDYIIKDKITDLIGIRVVCLYEDDIEKIKNILADHFSIIDETDKISQVESTEDSFGYKGLHLDLKIGEQRRELPEYKKFTNFNFEIQIRTITQDSWSVLDHKIKYKKSIPSSLKRRINTLAALFELADREFKEIKLATEEEIAKVEREEIEVSETTKNGSTGPTENTKSSSNGRLNAFGFLKIVKHFFKDYDFEDYKVDGFTQEIVAVDPNITRSDFNEYMKDNISKVKQYKSFFEKVSESNEKLNPFTIIRHCLYLHNKEKYSSFLTKVSKEAFDQWLMKNS